MYNTVPGLELYFEGTKFISHLAVKIVKFIRNYSLT